MKISCIAIDDEPLALEKMRSYIQKVPFLDLLSTFDNAIESIEFIKNHKVDLMFLDIQMDDFSGIQLLETLSKRPSVILTTAYDSYALKGYELNVSDYLLKPFSFDRFLHAVNKVFDHFSTVKHNRFSSEKNNTTDKKKDFIFIKTENRMQKIVFNDILFIEGMKDYLRVVTKHQKIMTLKNFSEMEALLPDSDFIRVHKSYIVAINKIESIEKKWIKIENHKIPVGETYKKFFLNILQKHGLI